VAKNAIQLPFPRLLPEFGNQGAAIRLDAIHMIEEQGRRIKTLHRW
jgi:hypothetical protein